MNPCKTSSIEFKLHLTQKRMPNISFWLGKSCFFIWRSTARTNKNNRYTKRRKKHRKLNRDKETRKASGNSLNACSLVSRPNLFSLSFFLSFAYFRFVRVNRSYISRLINVETFAVLLLARYVSISYPHTRKMQLFHLYLECELNLRRFNAAWLASLFFSFTSFVRERVRLFFSVLYCVYVHLRQNEIATLLIQYALTSMQSCAHRQHTHTHTLRAFSPAYHFICLFWSNRNGILD